MSLKIEGKEKMPLSFLKTGNASQALVQQKEAEEELRKSSQNKMWRFRLKSIGGGKYEDSRITFVDGNLNEEGFLLPPRYYEHFIVFNGNWTPFVCPEKTNPGEGEVCPICETGDNPSLVAVFTIIDHRTIKTKKGEVSNVPMLYVIKTQTFEILNKLAVKRGGLAGCTFDVGRSGDKSPSAGNVFDFVEKRDITELQKMYQKEITDQKTNQKSKVTYFIPADYETEIVYRTSAELKKMGFTKPNVANVPGWVSNNTTDYSNQL